jgi:hypothetical protein
MLQREKQEHKVTQEELIEWQAKSKKLAREVDDANDTCDRLQRNINRFDVHKTSVKVSLFILTLVSPYKLPSSLEVKCSTLTIQVFFSCGVLVLVFVSLTGDFANLIIRA